MAGPDGGRVFFPASTRLCRPSDFNRVFKKSSRSRDRFFTVLARRNTGPSGRLGLAISKKNCKSAVGRNRLKRVIRESFRHARPALPTLDIVVMASPTAARADNATLRASLDKHWQRLSQSCAG